MQANLRHHLHHVCSMWHDYVTARSSSRSHASNSSVTSQYVGSIIGSIRRIDRFTRTTATQTPVTS